jgi:hypothetical protein
MMGLVVPSSYLIESRDRLLSFSHGDDLEVTMCDEEGMSISSILKM